MLQPPRGRSENKGYRDYQPASGPIFCVLTQFAQRGIAARGPKTAQDAPWLAFTNPLAIPLPPKFLSSPQPNLTVKSH
jgi:hypothetical protein